jgi:ABC-type dipeptide/oligopeptide/nickel transport system ATPase component
MFDNLILHDQTKQMLELFAKNPAHALLLDGASGSGKEVVAEALTNALLGLRENSTIRENPSVLFIEPDEKNTISISQVQHLQHFVKLRHGKNATNIDRLIIIRGADCMRLEAQNALLKFLEEPPEGIVILLTCTDISLLPQTIVSRAAHIPLRLPTKNDLIEFFSSQGYDNAAIEQNYLLSGGRPGLMTELLRQPDHPLQQVLLVTKELLKMTNYERLIRVNELAKEKLLSTQICRVLQQMATSMLARLAEKNATKEMPRWNQILQTAYETELYLSASGQTKLALTNLILHL